jgi:hypothetical protein
LELAGGGARSVEDAVVAPSSPLGQFVLTGTVRNRNGAVLAQASSSFEIVSGNLAVSVATAATLYRTGQPVTATGTLRNLGAADEPDAVFSVAIQAQSCDASVHIEAVPLAAGEERPYTVSFVPSDLCPGETQFGLLARVSSASSFAESELNFGTGAPAIDVTFTIPAPSVRLVRSSPSPVAVAESDLDAVTKTDSGALAGTFPFAVVLNGVSYQGFSQSVDGFLELLPNGGAPGPFDVGGGCLENTAPSATVIAPFYADLDASASGFVGYKHYPAGSVDRDGRAFTKDTLVFFWDAPAKGETQHNRLQVLVSEDGLARIDAPEIATAVVGGVCTQTGLVLPSGVLIASDAVAPFGLRVEQNVGRAPFQGSILVRNTGTFPGSVSLDYGRAGGPRTTQSLTVPAGESRSITFTDTVTGPTTYTVQATGDSSVSLQQIVSPSEGLLAQYTGPSDFGAGPVTLPFRITTTGAVPGPVTVSFTLSGASVSQATSRTYDLEPGIPTDDLVTFDLTEGVSTVTVATPDVPLQADAPVLRAGPSARVSFAAAMAGVQSGVLHIGVDISNTGLLNLVGEIQVDGIAGLGTAITVLSGQTTHFDVTADLAIAPPGTNSYVVRLVSGAGIVLGETTVTYAVRGPQVALVSSPAGSSLDPGPATLHFHLRNTGDQRAVGTFGFQVFDDDLSAGFDLSAGGETDVAFDILVEGDVEQKTYPGRYVIKSPGTADVTGQVNFTVNGIALTVQPSLDKDAYHDGDTAHVTVGITNGRPGLGTDYLVRVHYASFEQTQPVTVSGSASVAFDIPLPQVTGESAFLGVSHPDGRSLHINTFHIRRADALASVTLDQQVYQPGGSVSVTATTASAGTLTLSAPGYSETIMVAGPVSRTFTIPADLPGGTYAVSWSFSGGAGSASGSTPFDVAGLRVRVFEASLDQGRYASGGTIHSTLQINTNQATTATLRAFILDPEGVSQTVGETAVALTPEADLLATNSWPFASSIAGLHRLVCGIYQPSSDTLLASGSLAFDVGNATVLGVRTDRSDYTTPDTAVDAAVSAFVSGPASLRLEVDGQSAATPDVTGTGIVDLHASLNGIAPGPHELVAVMEGGGYSSRATTTFAMGTSLPDLVPGLPSARPVSGGSWKIDVSVSNIGRTDAPATVLLVLDTATGSPIGTASVPALGPGASAVVSVDWNVLGKAGSREVEAVADAGDAVHEFREDNNRTRATLEIPALTIGALAAPSYPANVQAALGASITDLTASTTYTGLVVAASVTRPGGVVVPLAPAPVPPLGPGATVAVGTPWAVGRSVPGTYVLQSQLLDASAATLGSSTTAFGIAPTLAFSGTVSASPSPAFAGQAVTITGHIQNEGNVAATGTARFELVGPGHAIVAQATQLATVPLEGSADVTATINPLDLQPGDYELDLELDVQDQVYPVARSPLSVTGARIDAQIAPDLTPRVLVYVGGSPQDPAGVARRTAFVQASLAGSSVVLKTTADPLEFALLFRSGLWNTYVLMTDGPIPVSLLAEELREAVFRGDGLVFIPWRAAGGATELETALGVKVDGQLTGTRHTLNVLAGPLGPAQSLMVKNPAARLKLEGATLVGTLDDAPGLTVNNFGLGRDVTMAFDPAVLASDPARAGLQQLFKRAVLYAAPQQARLAAAGTVIPLAVVLHNAGGTAQTVEVSLSLPSGVRIASVEDGPTSSDPPMWSMSLAAGAQQALRLQLVLPDQPGSYTVESTVKVNGHPIANPPTIVLDVPRNTVDDLAELIAALEALAVAPPERGDLQAAVALLGGAQALPTDLGGLEGRIRLAAEAAEKLGGIHSADLSGPRGDLDRLIAAWERASYELTLRGGTARSHRPESSRDLNRFVGLPDRAPFAILSGS